MLLGTGRCGDFSKLAETADRPERRRRCFPRARLAAVAGRLDQSMPVGNEGAGVVVAAGARNAQSWVGRRVATQTFGMYAQLRIARIANCLLLGRRDHVEAGRVGFHQPADRAR